MNDTISINDLIMIANIIDVASTRGAFKAEELSEVGAVYDRIAHIIAQKQNSQPAEPPSGE